MPSPAAPARAAARTSPARPGSAGMGPLPLAQRAPGLRAVARREQRLAHGVVAEDARDLRQRADVDQLLRARDEQEDDDARGLPVDGVEGQAGAPSDDPGHGLHALQALAR